MFGGSSFVNWQEYMMWPDFWQSLGVAMGWEHTEKRWCKMEQNEVYKLEKRDGVIVGESRDKQSWWIQWNDIGNRYKYGKEFIQELPRGEDWKEKWHSLIDFLVAGKNAEDYFKEILTP